MPQDLYALINGTHFITSKDRYELIILFFTISNIPLLYQKATTARLAGFRC